MNRYPQWVYVTIAVALVLGLLYTLPNFFGEAPAVQVSTARTTLKIDSAVLGRVEDALKKTGIQPTGVFLDINSVKVRFADTDTQLKAKDVINQALNPDPQDPSYTVALNLLSNSPAWLAAIPVIPARPMYLGLDLRGGVHFLLQVDMRAALAKQLDSYVGDMRALIAEQLPDLQLVDAGAGSELRLVASIRPEAQKRIQETALKQNIQTLHNRINELGVAEPVIQQQGSDRVVVELPGVQDTAKAKEILGRTATLEVRLVDEDAMRSNSTLNVDVFPERRRDGSVSNVPTKKQVLLTGDRFTGAGATFDQHQQPAVSINLDAAGGRVMLGVTRENLGHLMAIILIERGKGEAISVAKIQGEFSNRFQITGLFTPEETNTLALLIRAGSLAAPMEIIEERTVGPSLGAENIKKGFDSTIYGFAALSLFIIAYYVVFGVFSTLALCSNLLLLVALLSMLQATLTLPGIAAIALTLGMAIDANVLINERVREELRGGATPQAAIHAGYERAFGTILDSNVTTLIAGLSLLLFGSGPVRGFAVVHCLGILTSIFSSVVVSRSMVNLAFGSRRRLERVPIGNTSWK